MPDPLDEQIRTLVARTVAQAPQPPSVEDIEDIGDMEPTRPMPLPRHLVRGRKPGRAEVPIGRRPVLAAAAAVASLALGIVGVLASSDRSDDDVNVGDRGPDVPRLVANDVRYLPSDTARWQPTGIEDSVAAPAHVGASGPPTPAVTVLRRDDGVLVRIVRHPTRASSTTATTAVDTTSGPSLTDNVGPGTSAPPASTLLSDGAIGPGSASGGTAVPVGGGATPGSGSSGSTTTVTVPATSSPTSTVPALPSGVAPRQQVEPATVRGGSGAIERHSSDTATVWFVHQGRQVAVDVFGLDPVAAVALVDGLVAQPDGGLAPPGGEGLAIVSEVPAGSPDDLRPATTRLQLQSRGGDTTWPLVVTTIALEPDRQDLLTAAALHYGSLERWGEREVLADRSSPDGVTAAFVDGSDALVVVSGDTEAEVRASVGGSDGLVGLDAASWRAWLGSVSDDLADQHVVSSVSVGSVATVSERRAEGREATASPGGHCLELPGTDPTCRPIGGSSTEGAPAVGHHVLVAGEWWYFGYVPSVSAVITVAPDRGDPTETSATSHGGRAWFAVRLPEAATSAVVTVEAPGSTGSVDTAPTTVDVRRPAS